MSFTGIVELRSEKANPGQPVRITCTVYSDMVITTSNVQIQYRGVDIQVMNGQGDAQQVNGFLVVVISVDVVAQVGSRVTCLLSVPDGSGGTLSADRQIAPQYYYYGNIHAM